MSTDDKVNILLVDDQPGKLLSYEVMLAELGDNFLKASSAKEALAFLLKVDVAVILVDVCMPELDGFELATMIRNHPRFQKVAIIFISAVHLTESDYLRGYDAGAVDYVPVPVVPELLRAKVRVFSELYRKTRQLEQMNQNLEMKVSERTAALQASTERLMQSERSRSLALAAGNMGSWDYDFISGAWTWDEGQREIFGVRDNFEPTLENVLSLIHPDSIEEFRTAFSNFSRDNSRYQGEFRLIQPAGDVRWCAGAAAATFDEAGQLCRLSGVIADITERKETETRQGLLVREVDHRARNALAVVQAIVRLARADTTAAFVEAVEGRIRALAKTHELLSQSRWRGADIARLIDEEMAPYSTTNDNRITIDGPAFLLSPDKAQTLALALHELATNAAKYGALSQQGGELAIRWRTHRGNLILEWHETGGPPTEPPLKKGFGTSIIHASLNSGQGSVNFDWRATGLYCSLTIVAATTAEIGQPHPPASRDLLDKRASSFGHKILLVEDEPLIGMVIRDLLIEWGFNPTSPFSNLQEAMLAANAERYDGAILDMNLNGQPVYPLASILASQSVPFVFLTGYAKESVDDQYAEYPVLQKPFEPELLRAILA